MLSTTSPEHGDAEEDRSQKPPSFLTRKIWLPKLIYDALPYFYLTVGFTAFFATLYISEWFWVLPHYLLFSATCIHLAIVVYRRRHRDPAQGAATRGRARSAHLT